MGRPSDWYPLADSDPVPGDPYEVAALGKRFRDTAVEIQRQVDSLGKLCTDEFWDSDAGREFRTVADETRGKLRKAFDRYDAAATAVGTQPGYGSGYASELAHAQQMADAALRRAKDADAERRQAQSLLDQICSNPTHPAYPRLVETRRSADADLAAAHRAVAQARAIRDGAAKAAAAAIGTVIEHDGLKDSGWDKFKNWVHEHKELLDRIASVASWVATACGTLALFVGWIPIVGQALAAVLGAVALVASVVSLVCHLALALAGDASWLDVAVDVVAVVTFGVGRAAVGAVKGSSLAARATNRSTAFRGNLAKLTHGGKLAKGTAAYNRAVNRAWRMANRATRGPRGWEAVRAVREAPGRHPGSRELAKGFGPVSIAKDTGRAARELTSAEWSKPLSKETWQEAKLFVGDPEAHGALAKLGKVDEILVKDVAAARFVTDAHSNYAIWKAATRMGIGTDLADKGVNYSGVKKPLVWSPGS